MVTSTRNNILSIIEWIYHFYSFSFLFFWENILVSQSCNKARSIQHIFSIHEASALWLSIEFKMNSEPNASETQASQPGITQFSKISSDFADISASLGLKLFFPLLSSRDAIIDPPSYVGDAHVFPRMHAYMQPCTGCKGPHHWDCFIPLFSRPGGRTHLAIPVHNDEIL